MDDLDALEALLAKATPRPWRIVQWVGRRVVEWAGARYPHTEYLWTVAGVVSVGSNEANSELAVASVNALPDLLAELRRLRRVEAAARAVVEMWDPRDSEEMAALRAALEATP